MYYAAMRLLSMRCKKETLKEMLISKTKTGRLFPFSGEETIKKQAEIKIN